jgi:UV DNA damage endonuclease
MDLGYACINMTLSNQKPKVTTNRSMIKRTFHDRGVSYASQLALENVRDLFHILKWNKQNNVKLFRLSSEIFPWASEYDFRNNATLFKN